MHKQERNHACTPWYWGRICDGRTWRRHWRVLPSCLNPTRCPSDCCHIDSTLHLSNRRYCCIINRGYHGAPKLRICCSSNSLLNNRQSSWDSLPAVDFRAFQGSNPIRYPHTLHRAHHSNLCYSTHRSYDHIA